MHGGPDYVKPRVDAPPAWRIEYPQAADVANTRWWEQFGDPVLTALIESALRGQPRPRDRGGARRCVPRPARDDAQPVLSAGELQPQRQPQPVERGRQLAPAARHRSVLHAVPGRARRRVADRSFRARAPPDRGRASPRLRDRAGPARRRAVGGHQRGRELHRACARSTASSRSRSRPRRTTRTRCASSNCGTRAASFRSSSSSRSSRNTSRRSPPFLRSSSASPRRKT